MDLTTFVRALQIYGAAATCGGIVVTGLARLGGGRVDPDRLRAPGLFVTLGITALVIGSSLDVVRLVVAWLDITGSRWGDASSALVTVVLDTVYGRATVSKSIVAVTLYLLHFSGKRLWWGMGQGFLLLLLGLTFGWTGHAAGGPMPLLTISLQSIHTLAAFAWFGGIAVLVPVSWGGAWKEAWFWGLLGRFSRLGLAGMVLLVVSGAITTLLRLKSPEQLVDTPYGQMLTVKLLWIAAVLFLAAVHRNILLPRYGRITRDMPAGRAGAGGMGVVRLTLALESAVGAMVLWYAIGLATTPPPS